MFLSIIPISMAENAEHLYLSNNTFTDTFENYDYLSLYSFEENSSFTYSDFQLPNATVNSTEYKRALSGIFDGTSDQINYIATSNLWLGSEKNITNKICGLWYYINDTSAFDYIRVELESSPTNYYAGYIDYFENDTNTGWNHQTWNCTQYSTGAPDSSAIRDFSIYYYANTTYAQNITIAYDGLFAYNPNNYMNTSNWTMTDNQSLQLANNSYSYNTTALSAYGDAELELESFDYDDFEVIGKFKMVHDLGTELCQVNPSTVTDRNGLSIKWNRYWVTDGDGNVFFYTFEYTLNKWAYFKIYKQGDIVSFYYANMSDTDNWRLLLNFTENPSYPISTLRFNTMDAHCMYDEVVIREIIPSIFNLSSAPLIIEPSFIYQDNEENELDNITYSMKRIYRGVTTYENYTTTSPLDWTPRPFTLTEAGIYNLYLTVCDDDGNCNTNVSSNSLNIGLDSLDIAVYDEETEQLIKNQTNTTVIVDIGIYGDSFSHNYTTQTGTLNVTDLGHEEYQIRYSAIGYDPRVYYVTLSGSDASINLYLLNSTNSDRVILSLLDENSDPATEIRIKMQRNYISDNVSIFKIVSMTETNYEGEAALYAELYDVWYKLIYEKDEVILKTTTPSPFFETTTQDKVNLGGDAYWSFRNYDNVLYNLSYINDSGTIFARFFYSDSNNVLRKACLNVQRITGKEINSVCHNCTTSASATISCIIPHTLPGQFKAVASVDTNSSSSWYILTTEWWDAKELNNIFGQQGVFFTMLLAGSVGLMGLSSVVGSILLMVLGLIGMSIATFIVGFNIGWMYYMVIFGFIIIFLVKKSGDSS